MFVKNLSELADYLRAVIDVNWKYASDELWTLVKSDATSTITIDAIFDEGTGILRMVTLRVDSEEGDTLVIYEEEQ